MRKKIDSALSDSDPTIQVKELVDRLNKVENENAQLRSIIQKLESRLSLLENPKGSGSAAASQKPTETKKASKDDDDFDLFDDDGEDSAEKQRITEERLKAYAEKKSAKPAVIAKSSVLLDVKPWDDETDMKQLEESVRSIKMEGLVWGSSKLVPVAFKIKKLQIQCVIEDDKVTKSIYSNFLTSNIYLILF
jgi:translation elongation factor EF-1beta